MGQTVTLISPSKRKSPFQKEHGFKGYTEKEKTIDGADVHFIGIWVLKAYKKISIEKKWDCPAESKTLTFWLTAR